MKHRELTFSARNLLTAQTFSFKTLTEIAYVRNIYVEINIAIFLFYA